jgi:tRNA-2-methylthio-N6-dimethylallyladenosine synthase
VDLVVGPDAHKDLPNLLAEVEEGRDAINVIKRRNLRRHFTGSLDEQMYRFGFYHAGCDNMCTFCVVPYPWTRTQSSPSIMKEIW